MGAVSFQWEPLRKVLKEPNINDLLLEHWRELAVHQNEMPLDPDYALLLDADDKGYFRVWTARDGKLLVGYIAFWIRPHAHYKSTLTGMEDLYLLTASQRLGSTGARMFRTAIDAIKARGVQRAYLHEKVHYQRERHTENCIRSARKKLGIGDEVPDSVILDVLEEYADGTLGKLFKRMGFTRTDTLWSKML